MKRFANIFLISILFTKLVFASDIWLGPLTVKTENRGERNEFQLLKGDGLNVNIAGYTNYTVIFEYYKHGVTDTGSDVSTQLEAKTETIQESTGLIVRSSPLVIIGRNGNNLIYQLKVGKVAPDTFGEIPPELRNHSHMKTAVNLKIDGQIIFSIPIDFTYIP